jgi:TrmH family RNA methyltransferase
MAKPETITSAANPLIKDVRRAISRGTLTGHGWCVAETFHLLEEALRGRGEVKGEVKREVKCEVKTVLASETALPSVEALIGPRPIKIVTLSDALFAGIGGTENSQGVIALVQLPEWKFEQLWGPAPLIILLDGLQDPGNAGTIVRTAEAFGATGIFFLKGTVSPFNPKTLRASAGSLFRVPFIHGVDPAAARASLRQRRVALFAGLPATETKLASVDLTGPCAFVIGNEAHGVSPELVGAATGVTIPTVGVESLNAAMAAGILLYEARRQRMLRP